MNPFTSFYLNTTRVIAALCVFVSHCTLSFFSADTLNHPYLLTGHNMVIVFFVISGFVIAYSADRKEKKIDIYLIDRVSRLYSVIIPALVFTFFIDGIGNYFAPEQYVSFVKYDITYYLRFAITFFNLQQIWNWSSMVSTNGPFWSVAYEFWYYLLFGVLFVMKGNKKYFYAFIIAFIMGPKILLLLPCWLLGVITYFVSKKVSIKYPVLNYILFIISLLVLVLFLFNYIHLPFRKFGQFGYAPLFFSADFINDFFMSLLFSINIWSATQINTVNVHIKASTFVRYIADGTFTLYLFHFPLIVFASCIIPYDKNNFAHLILLMFLMSTALIVLGNYIENYRFALRAFIVKYVQKTPIL